MSRIMDTYRRILSSALHHGLDSLTGQDHDRQTRDITYDEAHDLLDSFESGHVTKLPATVAGANSFTFDDAATAQHYLDDAENAYNLRDPALVVEEHAGDSTYEIRFSYFSGEHYRGELVFHTKTDSSLENNV